VLLLKAPELPAGADPRQNLLVMRTLLRVPEGVVVHGRTGQGHMSVKRMHAAVSLETGRGDVEVHKCTGDVEVRTEHCNHVIVDQHRGGLSVHAGQGSMQVFVAELGPRGVELVTRTGNIQSHLPHDAAFQMDVSTRHGKLLNGFAVPVVEQVHDGKTGFTMRGAVRGGGPPVRMTTELGNISVRAKVFERRP
jgi:hypothetical protein